MIQLFAHNDLTPQSLENNLSNFFSLSKLIEDVLIKYADSYRHYQQTIAEAYENYIGKMTTLSAKINL